MSRYDIEKFDPPPDPDLICCICQCVLDSPQESPCRHVFCKVCISQWLAKKHNCPSCRQRMRYDDMKPVLPLVQNMLNRLNMICDFSGNGCDEKIPLEMFDNHIKNCDFEYLDCKFKPCLLRDLRKIIKVHEADECEFREVMCDKQCGLMISIKDVSTHDCLTALKKKCEEHITLAVNLKKELAELKEKLKQHNEEKERNAQQRRSLISSGSDTYWDSTTDDSSDATTEEFSLRSFLHGGSRSRSRSVTDDENDEVNVVDVDDQDDIVPVDDEVILRLRNAPRGDTDIEDDTTQELNVVTVDEDDPWAEGDRNNDATAVLSPRITQNQTVDENDPWAVRDRNNDATAVLPPRITQNQTNNIQDNALQPERILIGNSRNFQSASVDTTITVPSNGDHHTNDPNNSNSPHSDHYSRSNSHASTPNSYVSNSYNYETPSGSCSPASVYSSVHNDDSNDSRSSSNRCEIVDLHANESDESRQYSTREYSDHSDTSSNISHFQFSTGSRDESISEPHSSRLDSVSSLIDFSSDNSSPTYPDLHNSDSNSVCRSSISSHDSYDSKSPARFSEESKSDHNDSFELDTHRQYNSDNDSVSTIISVGHVEDDESKSRSRTSSQYSSRSDYESTDESSLGSPGGSEHSTDLIRLSSNDSRTDSHDSSQSDSISEAEHLSNDSDRLSLVAENGSDAFNSDGHLSDIGSLENEITEHYPRFNDYPTSSSTPLHLPDDTVDTYSNEIYSKYSQQQQRTNRENTQKIPQSSHDCENVGAGPSVGVVSSGVKEWNEQQQHRDTKNKTKSADTYCQSYSSECEQVSTSKRKKSTKRSVDKSQLSLNEFFTSKQKPEMNRKRDAQRAFGEKEAGENHISEEKRPCLMNSKEVPTSSSGQVNVKIDLSLINFPQFSQGARATLSTASESVCTSYSITGPLSTHELHERSPGSSEEIWDVASTSNKHAIGVNLEQRNIMSNVVTSSSDLKKQNRKTTSQVTSRKIKRRRNVTLRSAISHRQSDDSLSEGDLNFTSQNENMSNSLTSHAPETLVRSDSNSGGIFQERSNYNSDKETEN